MRSLRRIAGFGLCCVLLACSSAAQAQKKPQLSEHYSRWLNEEVVYLITEGEKKDFLRLTTDEAREQFVDDFWRARNPSPGSPQNSFKDEHYRRLAYVNDRFGRKSNTPGWRTDMGRTWILFGKPKSQEAFLNNSQLYPCELWFYSNDTGNPSIPPHFSLLFFMPEDAGEYRYYRPFLDGPMKLVRGTQFNTNADVYKFLRPFGADLALASMVLVPGEPFDNQTYTPGMGSDLLLARIQNFANDYYNVRRLNEQRDLHTFATSYLLTADQRPLDLNTLVLADPAGQYWVDYAVSIDRPELGKTTSDPKNLSVTLSWRLLTEAGKVVVEDSLEREWVAFAATDGKKTFLPFQIAGRLPVSPGKYILEFTIPQHELSKSYQGRQPVIVGGGNSISLSGPLLFSSISKARQPDSTTPFQYFGTQFEPAARHVVSSRLPLRILYQMEAASAPQDLDVEYLVANTHDHDARKMVMENIRAAQFRDRKLMTSKALPLTGMPDGDYRVVVTVRPAGSQETLVSANVALRVDSNVEAATLYFDPNSRKMNAPGVAAYIRSLGASSLGDQNRAVTYLRQAVDQNPANTLAAGQLVRSYFEAKRFGDIAALYNKVGQKPFETSVESLAQVALSLWNTGAREGARAVLTDARQAFGEDPLVTAVSKTVK